MGPTERIAASRAPDGAANRVRRLALATMTTARGREILKQESPAPARSPATAQHVLLQHAQSTSPVHLTDTARRNGTAMNHPHTEHQPQRVEELVSWTGPERLRFLWYRLRLTVSEMNYSVRRKTELQMRLA